MEIKSKGYLENCLLYVVEKNKINFDKKISFDNFDKVDFFGKEILERANKISNQKRQEEFLLGQYYLNVLLKQYKIPTKEIGKYKNGALKLPKGIKGNLSHSKKKLLFV